MPAQSLKASSGMCFHMLIACLRLHSLQMSFVNPGFCGKHSGVLPEPAQTCCLNGWGAMMRLLGDPAPILVEL